MVIKSAGNSSADACGWSSNTAPDVIVVGATQENSARQPYSNFGSCVDIWAPGNNIVAASSRGPDARGTYSGTSMSAPMVAGTAAALVAQFPQPASQISRGVYNPLIYSGTRAPAVPLSDLGPGSPAIFLNSLHR